MNEKGSPLMLSEIATKGNSSSTYLALTVLFGEEFLQKADEALLMSLHKDSGRWREMILQMWAIMKPSDSSSFSLLKSATPDLTADAVHHMNGNVSIPAHLYQQTANASISGSSDQAHHMNNIDFTNPINRDKHLLPIADHEVNPSPQGETTASFQLFNPNLESAEQTSQAEAVSYEEIKSLLVNLLVEKTGYPAEVLEDNLDLELDLGIDSVKQLEVLGRVREQYQLELDEDFRMRDYNTIKAITDFIVAVLPQQKETSHELSGAVQ